MGTKAPIACNFTKGDICDEGTAFPSRAVVSASICKPGQYFGYGQCNPCQAGHVCVKYTNTKYPVYLDTEGGYECPAGYYCPAGSSKEIACPAGTYNPFKKGKSDSSCI